MLMWCLSGIVMMYVPYPSLSEHARLAALAPIDWSRCCSLGTTKIDLASLEIEMLGRDPVLRDGAVTIGLNNSETIERVDAQKALGVARQFGGRPVVAEMVDRDQWTVSGDFTAARPFWRIVLHDAADTVLYVSAKDGRAAQIATGRARFWNWFGAIPHWLYFTPLRRNGPLWNNVVIALSLAGVVLVLVGLVVGTRQFLRRPAGRWTGYIGLLRWHHLPALVFGLFVLNWTASGLLSMNPWGLLEGGDASGDVRMLMRTTTSDYEIRMALARIAKARPAGVVALQAAPLLGRTYFVTIKTDGARERLDLRGVAAPLGTRDWQLVAQTLHLAKLEKLDNEDDYYFSHHGDAAPLPVYRGLFADGTRTYFDAISGAMIARFDSSAMGYRWWHQGLHRLDFAAALRQRPLWDIVMLILLASTTFVTATGAWLGMRRLSRKTP